MMYNIRNEENNTKKSFSMLNSIISDHNTKIKNKKNDLKGIERDKGKVSINWGIEGWFPFTFCYQGSGVLPRMRQQQELLQLRRTTVKVIADTPLLDQDGRGGKCCSQPTVYFLQAAQSLQEGKHEHQQWQLLKWWHICDTKSAHFWPEPPGLQEWRPSCQTSGV